MNSNDKSIEKNNIFESEWFTNKGDDLKNGFYTLEVSCPIDKVLPDEVRKIFGERNRNIYGKFVHFDPIGGNTIRFSYGIVIKNDDIQVIDMQKQMSEL